jgi:hypothetical protein
MVHSAWKRLVGMSTWLQCRRVKKYQSRDSYMMAALTDKTGLPSSGSCVRANAQAG